DRNYGRFGRYDRDDRNWNNEDDRNYRDGRDGRFDDRRADRDGPSRGGRRRGGPAQHRDAPGLMRSDARRPSQAGASLSWLTGSPMSTSSSAAVGGTAQVASHCAVVSL